MEVQLKTHTKVNVGDIPVGKTFRLVNLMRAYQVLDLTKIRIPDGQGGVRNVELLPEVVYATDLSTGVVEAFSSPTEVYLCPMKSFETDEM